jgi:stage V sporulation protein B
VIRGGVDARRPSLHQIQAGCIDLTVGSHDDKRRADVADHNPPSEPKPTSQSGADSSNRTAGEAGRGGVAVAVAKLYFLLVGLIQQVLLTRVLGTAGYGGLSTALSVSAVVYNPIVTTSIQGVSRTVARADDAERPFTTRRVLLIHARLALPIAVVFGLFAGPIVKAVHAPHLVLPVRILSAVLFFYGLYAPLVGVLNGRRLFVWQAGFDIAFATIRTALMIAGAVALTRASHHGVVGASIGFAAAAAIIFLAALLITGTGQRGPAGPGLREYLAFIGPVFAGQILLNLLQQADLTVLRFFAASAAIRDQLSPQAADPLVGAYRATQLFCFLPYQLLLSITFVLFPLLAKAHRDERMADVRLYVITGVRLALIIAGMMVSIISGLSGPLLRLVFPQDVAIAASTAMQLLALGFGAFAIFGILSTVLTSLKAERQSAIITGLAFALVAVLGSILLQHQSFGAHLLLRTAIATSIGLVVATLVAGYFVHRLAGGVVSPLTLIRVLAAAAATIAVGRWCSPDGRSVAFGVAEHKIGPDSKLLTVAAAAALAAMYFVLLGLSREVTKRDLLHVRSVFGKPRSASA